MRTHQPACLPLIAGALAIGIFIFDTISPLQFAVAVLYAVVVLVAALTDQRRMIFIVAGSCAALTILSYPIAHGFRIVGTAPIRSIMSLAAIGITTFLSLKNLSANERLREAERQRANLARFFSPQRVEQLVQLDTPLSVARCQSAAVVFVDMVGSTAYCASLAPDAVIVVLRELLTLLSACVFAHNGMIDKYLGDGLLAVFGAPQSGPADATNAARCALDIQKAVDRWNERRQRTGAAAIRVAVGIHYGDVVQGDVGGEMHIELTVAGDTVNIASRVEAYCRSLDAAVLVTDALVDSLRAEGSEQLAEIFKDEGQHKLRGRPDPIHLFSVRRTIDS